MPNDLQSLMHFLERPLIKMRGRIRRHGFDFSTTHPRMHGRLRGALTRNFYEGPELDMISRYLKPDDKVLEVGICVGVTSLVISRIVGAENVVLYEADPLNYDLARTNFELNRVPLDMRNRVLWSGPDRPATMAFHSNENPSSSSLLQRDNVIDTVDIETDALEDVFVRFAPTVFCADIEGGEIELIGKCKDFGSVRMILLETHARLTGQDAVDKMLDHLAAQGFQIVEGQGTDFVALQR